MLSPRPCTGCAASMPECAYNIAEATKEGAGPGASVLPDARENGGRPSSVHVHRRLTTPAPGMGMPELRERAGGVGIVFSCPPFFPRNFFRRVAP